jgi:hypothetical protein
MGAPAIPHKHPSVKGDSMKQLFIDGPFEELTATADAFVVETGVQRLLKWGAAPAPSNEANAEHMVKAVTRLGEREDWYGMEPARFLRLKGWPEGLEIAKRYTQQLPEFHMESIERRRVWDATGDEFDRDRFDAGLDECWQSRRRIKVASRPVLKLTCAIGGRCKQAADELVWMGAAAFAICDAAEAAGYRLEIEAISHTTETWKNDGRDLVQRIRVKAADEPLDRETTVMALACPAFFRWHVIHSRCAVSPELTMEDHAGATRSIAQRFHGDLHMNHAYDFESAKQAVAGLIQSIETMAA